jgi:hypothetical protein
MIRTTAQILNHIHSAIFRDIMVPLAQHWANPAVTDDLKSKLLVLGPEVRCMPFLHQAWGLHLDSISQAPTYTPPSQ